MKGAKHWLTGSGYKPDMFVAPDVPSSQVWYGALRIDMLKFFYTSPSVHTLYSRNSASPARAVARAITAVYDIALPSLAEGVGDVRLPTINIGMLGGGTVANAIPSETWFTVDLRSLDTPTHDRLRAAVIEAARHIADEEHVGFRMEHTLVTEDYSQALSQEQRLNHSLVQTAVATANHFRKSGNVGNHSHGPRVDRCEHRDQPGNPSNCRRSSAIEQAASAGGECPGDELSKSGGQDEHVPP